MTNRADFEGVSVDNAFAPVAKPADRLSFELTFLTLAVCLDEEKIADVFIDPKVRQGIGVFDGLPPG